MNSTKISAVSILLVLFFLNTAIVISAEKSILKEPVLRPLPLGSIKPSGWLEDQLQIQANGLTGHLDEFWPDIRNSGWIGGEAEGWERLPYWLDGLVPLAFLLQDEALIEKVNQIVTAILERQNPDGWLGPEKSATGRYQARDPWPVFVAIKALTQYESATGDPRIQPSIHRFLKVLDHQTKRRPLFDWNRMRWQDGALSVYWLYDRTGEPWLIKLASRLHEQGYDWIQHFENLPHKTKVSKWEHESHVVNNAMGIKTAAVWYRQSKNPNHKTGVARAIEELDKYHGQVSGVFSGDECFSGLMPSQGTETCAVVEYLFSLETAISILGSPAFGDRLELIAFNALPAPFKPDMCARQYVQQSNQPIARVSTDRIYTTNGEESNVFGLETNYGCCTANMHQGWPKYAASLWMKSQEGGLTSISYAPAIINSEIKGNPIRVTVDSVYPFEEEIHLTIESATPIPFPLHLRIPDWASSPSIQIQDQPSEPVQPGSFHKVERTWGKKESIRLILPMSTDFQFRFNNAVSLKRGPIVYSLNIRDYWKLLKGQPPFADWEVFPTSLWNYALEINPQSPQDSVRFESGTVGVNPFDPKSTPVKLVAYGRLLPEWGLDRNAAAAPPVSPVKTLQPKVELELVPYGAAKLRISEFPWTETSSDPK